MAGRSKVNWLAIRTAYVVQQWTAERCAKEFGLDPTTIRKRASKEGWTQERHRLNTHAEDVADEAVQKAVNDAARKQQMVLDGLILWSAQFIRDSNNDLGLIKNPYSRVRARRDVIEMIGTFAKTHQIANIDRPQERDDTLTIVQQRVEPYKIAVGEDGRAIPELMPPDDDDGEPDDDD